MRMPMARRAGLVALTVLVALSAVAPVTADSRARKIEPQGMVRYRPGRVFTPSTDVTSVSGYAAWMIDEALGAMTPLPKLGSAFLRAERKEGINARYLVAHALLESGWGTSDIARLKHNLFGYNAYDRDPWKYASSFRTYAAGVAAVAAHIRDTYLTPGGRWFYRYTTLRGMNMYYASDPGWADKISHLANRLDQLVVTLRERGLRFERPELHTSAHAGGSVAVDIPWSARPGAVLPAGIRFAARWSPVEVVEASPTGPTSMSPSSWKLARRTAQPGRVERVVVGVPAQPGIWRIEVEARDSDGRPLPKSDRAPIRPLTVRVAADREVGISLAVGRDGRIEATLRNVGRRAVDAVAGGAATGVEAWALPLDPATQAFRLTAVPLDAQLAPRASRVVRFAAPPMPAVVVVRITGDPEAIGRSRPAVGLVRRVRDGRPELGSLSVASGRDDALLGRATPQGWVTLEAVEDQGTVRALVAGRLAEPAFTTALAAAEGAPGLPSLLVRSLAAEPGAAARPTRALQEVPAEPPSPATLDVTGLPPGIRLVMAGIVPADGGPIDPRSLRLAWIPVTAVAALPADPH